MAAAVTARVVVDDAGMSGHAHATVLTLAWTPADPLAVVLTLSAHPDHPALPRGEWAVLRDFLRYGLEEPTGDGDVRISPCDNGRAHLRLHGRSRTYAVHLPAEVLAEFLDRVDEIAPATDPDAAVDALIERLLGGDG